MRLASLPPLALILLATGCDRPGGADLLSPEIPRQATIAVDRTHLQPNDWSRYRVQAQLAGMTVTRLEDLHVIIGFRNVVNGQSALTQEGLSDGFEPPPVHSPSITIERVHLSRDWTRIRVGGTLAGFSVTELQDLQVLIGIRNIANGESAIIQTALPVRPGGR